MLRLKDVKKEEFAKFKESKAYVVLLSHGLCGDFPALVKDTGNVVVCLGIELMTDVIKLLSQRSFEIKEITLMIREDESYGFTKDHWSGEEVEALYILSKNQFDELVRKDDKPFKWAPGLVGRDTTAEEFADTLLSALKKHKEKV